MNLFQYSLIFAVRIYRWTLAPAQKLLFGPAAGCRFTPSCSQYAMEAIARHGAVGGTLLAAKRVCRCHPWGECGYDPVPDHPCATLRGGPPAALAAIPDQKSKIKNFSVR